MSEKLFYDITGGPRLAQTLAEQVAREVGRDIVAGRLHPGQLLDDEEGLCEDFGVSRTVVRDAMKMLSSKGIVSVRRGIGTTVRSRSDWQLFDNDVLAWHQSVASNSTYLRDLTELRSVIEPEAAGWAASRGSESDIKAITTALADMEASANDVERWVIADAAFHAAVLQASGNDFIAAMEGAMFSGLLASIHVTNPSPKANRASLPVHRDVREAIAGKDPGAARAAARRLIDEASARLREAGAVDS